MADFDLKAHDLLPSLRVQLLQGGRPLDLTSAVTVTFNMRQAATGGTLVVNNGPVNIENAVEGIVSHDWVDPETATPGDYFGEFPITWPWTGSPATKKETGPTQSYITISIGADLDNA